MNTTRKSQLFRVSLGTLSFLGILALTVLCVTFICPTHSFAQNFVEGQMPDTFLTARFVLSVRSIAFSPDGTTLASGGAEWNNEEGKEIGNVWLWDVATATLKDTLEGHTERVRSVAFSPDGTTLASGSEDYTVKLWDVATATLKGTLEGYTGRVRSIAFSPDGTTLASGSEDYTVKLWDVATATLKGTLEGHTDSISSIAFSPDSTTLASGSESDDNTVRLWDVATATLKNILRGHTDSISSVAFSPDGKTLASGGEDWNNEDGTVQLWDVASGALKSKLELPSYANPSYDRPIYANIVAFSPDGRTLVSGSSDNTVKLWDVIRQPKAPKVTLSVHGGTIYSVAFSPDGKLLASGSAGVIRLWKALPPANGDGVVNIADLVEVAQNFGQIGDNAADVNGDGVVDIIDIILVAVALGEVAGAPDANTPWVSMFTAEEVSQWLIEAKQHQGESPTYARGILFLERLLAVLTPEKTVLLPNYPNPFNPETWIPYQLAAPADVSIAIYAADGALVRRLALGHRGVGIYESKSRAAYWDGRNTIGEPVASGVYFYSLTTGEFSATRKMLIRK